MDTQAIALDWIDAWNKRDIDRIMAHYTDDIVFYSLTVTKRWNIADGKINGKEKLRAHFLKGLELAPNLYFEFIDVLSGSDGITIIYKRENGVLVADVAVIDDDGKATLVKAYYGHAG
jgi:hypothetical protein